MHVYSYITSYSYIAIVSRSQTAIFSFMLGGEKIGSGERPI